MSTINSNYSNYYNSYGLFSSSSTSSSSSSSNIYNLLSSTYGVNTAVKTTYQTNSAIRSAGESLSSVLSSLTATGNKSLFGQVNAVSSNEKTATATFDRSKTSGTPDSIELNVGQVATAQVNSGEGVNTSGKEVNSGIYKFEVQVGSLKKELSVNVSASDNNDDIQRKMASAINNAKLGVTASIDYSSKDKTQTLKVTAASTGNKNTDGSSAFSIRDTSGSLAKSMGVTNISKEAQNAIYSIGDGERKYSTSNKIDLGDGVSANLTGEGSTKISFERNNSAAVDKIKELVSSINSAMTSATGSTDRGSSRLFNDVLQLTKAYKSTLERIGINVSSSGVLSIDTDKLSAAVSSSGDDGNSLAKLSLEKMFQGGSSGFAKRLERISNNMKSTQYYGDQVDVKSAAKNSYYDKYSAVSSLLDMYF